MKKKVLRLCDEHCTQCDVVHNKQLAVLLNVLALKFGKEVWHITNRVCPNMTCCPICHIDDFCHDYWSEKCEDEISEIASIDELGEDDESCEVAEMAKEIFREFQTER